MLLAKFHQGGRSKERLPREKEVADRADRVDIAASVHRRRRLDGLGGHIKRRAGQSARLAGLLLVVDRLYQAKIEHLDDIGLSAPAIDHDIRRLNVAMHEP